MIKKEYIVPAVKTHKLELYSLMAGSDPDNPDWGTNGGPNGNGNQNLDEEDGSL